MISQSDDAGFKRPKHSPASVIRNEINQNEEEEDIISRLPDEILTHILSLLPDADVYRTRILSNRWNHLCFFLPFLCFKMPPPNKHSVEAFNKFYDFVDKTFSLRNRDMPVIKRFFLSCTYRYDHNRVLDWLRIVLLSKHVETLELEFPTHQDRFSLSLDLLMTCNNTLVDLTLRHVNMVGLSESQLLFPSLKRVKLESIKYTGGESPQNLISACPVLQELYLEGQDVCLYQLQTFKISSPSLKRLIIQWCDFGEGCNVVIDAPKLEYFYISDDESSTYSFTNPSSLVEAHIDIYSNADIQLTNISPVGSLTIAYRSLSDLSDSFRLNLPVFPNLVKLIVDFEEIPEWDTLFILLNSMPNLQHITIDFGLHMSPFRRTWNRPTEAPACLHNMVKEIVILNHSATHMKDHFNLIRYLLNHSSVLEKMTLNTNEINRREKLLKIRRRSKSCQIEFI